MRGFVATMPELVARQISLDPRVKLVEQDVRGSIASVNIQGSAPWHLDRIDQRSGTNGDYRYHNDGTGVEIFILDTGVRTTHDEFDSRAVFGADYGAADCGSDSGKEPGIGTDVTDDPNGHGTWVAGIAAGSTYGSAKGAEIVSVRVLDACGGGYASIIAQAIDEYVIPNASLPAVLNISLQWPTVSSTLDSAVQDAIDNGIVTVVAAGNGNTNANCCSPSDVDDAIVVGATDSSDARATSWAGGQGSDYGSKLDLFAPGDGITGAGASSDSATHTNSGTSAAAPIVAGIAARYLEAHPSASPADVRDALVNNATPVVSNPGSGSPSQLAYSAFIGPSPTGSAILNADGALYENEEIDSANNEYHLLYQSDGNLVLYDSDWSPLWASNTDGHSVGMTYMQTDGKLAVFDAGMNLVFSSFTNGNDGAYLIVQNDGNVVIYSPDEVPLWATNTVQSPSEVQRRRDPSWRKPRRQ